MKLNNNAEVAAAAHYKEEGWKILDSGWPDFLMWRWTGGRIEIKFAEIKSEGTNVRDNQRAALGVLSALAPTVVCKAHKECFREVRIFPPVQDAYYHRTDSTEWQRCFNHENCNVKYHVCEPRREENGR